MYVMYFCLRKLWSSKIYDKRKVLEGKKKEYIPKSWCGQQSFSFRSVISNHSSRDNDCHPSAKVKITRVKVNTHTHTHTYIYIYMYIYNWFLSL